jgi:hypothetical protein
MPTQRREEDLPTSAPLPAVPLPAAGDRHGDQLVHLEV